MQRFCSAVKVHGRKQANQAQVMIAMQVADKNMIDAADLYIKLQHLLLRAFAAIN